MAESLAKKHRGSGSNGAAPGGGNGNQSVYEANGAASGISIGSMAWRMAPMAIAPAWPRTLITI